MCKGSRKPSNTLDEKVVAYLHDVIEKGQGWTRARLEAEGFSPPILSAVDALTRREEEDDDTFVRRAASNRLARPVKLADLQDNLRQAQAAGLPSEKYRARARMLGHPWRGAYHVAFVLAHRNTKAHCRHEKSSQALCCPRTAPVQRSH